jgi:lipid-binding SYLF domain-containing protein
MRNKSWFLFLTLATALPAAAADDSADRLERAVAVFNTMTQSGHKIRPEQIAGADCIAVVPGFKKGAVVVGVGYGRGFISCRNGSAWSAPGAIALETGSLGVQVGGEKIDIVVVSLDKQLRSKLVSDRFTVGTDASAAWGDGKSAHDDPNTKILFFGHTAGVFAGFGLDGATLKPDDSGNKALYGKTVTNTDIVGGGVAAPAAASQLIAALTKASSR